MKKISVLLLMFTLIYKNQQQPLPLQINAKLTVRQKLTVLGCT